MKFYSTLFVITILLSSCYKQSIPDAMINSGNGGLATMSYEINGTPIKIAVSDANNRSWGSYTLSCQKNGGYHLSGVSNSGEFVFTFYTDSLKVGNYKNTGGGGTYVTDFGGYPCYVAGGTDNMNVNITSYMDGRISGNFTGLITPATMQGPFGNVYGTYSSVVIKNGLFNNVPVVY